MPINFKKSPFFEIVTAVSPVVTLQRTSQGDRGVSTAHLTLNADQREKLTAARTNASAPQYQLRLYCTSSDFYAPNAAYGTIRQPVPIEFPGTCEAKMNDAPVAANMKGIKKKPGTTPPANVGIAPRKSGHAGSSDFALSLEPGFHNRVDLNYINTDKLYYMIVYFVLSTTVEQVVEKIKRDKYRQKEEVIKSSKFFSTLKWVFGSSI